MADKESRPESEKLSQEAFEEMREEELENIDITPEEKMWAAASYLSFICVLTLFIKKDSRFCQFHGKQGLVLAVIFSVFRIFYIVRILIPFLGLIELAVIIYAGIQAITGRWWKIPGIYDISKKISF